MKKNYSFMGFNLTLRTIGGGFATASILLQVLYPTQMLTLKAFLYGLGILFMALGGGS